MLGCISIRTLFVCKILVVTYNIFATSFFTKLKFILLFHLFIDLFWYLKFKFNLILSFETVIVSASEIPF